MALQHFDLHQQQLRLTVDLEGRRIYGDSRMLLKAKRATSAISEFRLHCRQSKVLQVLVNGKDAAFTHLDALAKVCTENYRDMEAFELFHYGALAASSNGELMVTMPQGPDAPTSQYINVVVKYELENPTAGAFFMGPDEVNQNRPHYMYTFHPPFGGCSDGARTWFPCIDTLAEARCPFRILVTVPTGNMVVSNGQLIRQVLSEDESQVTFHYVVETPIAAPHVAMAVGPFVAFPDPDIPEVTHFCLPGNESKLVHTCLYPPTLKQPRNTEGDEEEAEAEAVDGEQDEDEKSKAAETTGEEVMQSSLSRIVKFFADRENGLGVAMPYHSYKQVFVERLPGQEHHFATHSCTFIDQDLLQGPDTRESLACVSSWTSRQQMSADGSRTGKRPVKTFGNSHLVQAQALLESWLGVVVGIASSRDAWLLSGLVGYFVNLYVEHVEGRECYRLRLVRAMDATVATEVAHQHNCPALWPPVHMPHQHTIPPMTTLLKCKAPMVVHLMERVAGDEAVMKAVRKFSLFPSQTCRRAGQLVAAQFGLGPAPTAGPSPDPAALQQMQQMRQATNSPRPPLARKSITPNPGGASSPAPRGIAARGVNASPARARESTMKTESAPSTPVQATADEKMDEKTDEKAGEQNAGAQAQPPPANFNSPAVQRSLARLNTVREDAMPGECYKTYSCMATMPFLHEVRKNSDTSSGQQLTKSFLTDWIENPGVAVFRVGFFFNRKQNQAEVVLEQDVLKSRGRIFKGKVLIWIYEREGMYDYEKQVDEQRHHWKFSCHSSVRKRKRAKTKKVAFEGEEEDEAGLTRQQKIAKANKAEQAPDDAVSLARYKNDTPLLWVRVDPEFEWLREVKMKQPDFMWTEQLCSDGDVAAQVEALRALTEHPTPTEELALDRGSGVYGSGGGPSGFNSILAEKRLACSAIHDCLLGRGAGNLYDDHDEERSSHCDAVRVEAAHALAKWQTLHAPRASAMNKTTNENWHGLILLLDLYRLCFFDPETNLPARNNFNDPLTYALQKDMATALVVEESEWSKLSRAGIRARNGYTPKEVGEFVLSLLRDTDNSGNQYDDSLYIGYLLLATTLLKTQSADADLQGAFDAEVAPTPMGGLGGMVGGAAAAHALADAGCAVAAAASSVSTLDDGGGSIGRVSATASPAIPAMPVLTGTPRTPAGSLARGAASVLGLQLREEALRLIRFQNLQFLRGSAGGASGSGGSEMLELAGVEGAVSHTAGGAAVREQRKSEVLTACALEALVVVRVEIKVGGNKRCALELRRGKRTLFSYGSYAAPQYGRWVRLAAAQSVLQMRMAAEPQAMQTMLMQANVEEKLKAAGKANLAAQERPGSALSTTDTEMSNAEVSSINADGSGMPAAAAVEGRGSWNSDGASSVGAGAGTIVGGEKLSGSAEKRERKREKKERKREKRAKRERERLAAATAAAAAQKERSEGGGSFVGKRCAMGVIAGYTWMVDLIGSGTCDRQLCYELAEMLVQGRQMRLPTVGMRVCASSLPDPDSDPSLIRNLQDAKARADDRTARAYRQRQEGGGAAAAGSQAEGSDALPDGRKARSDDPEVVFRPMKQAEGACAEFTRPLVDKLWALLNEGACYDQQLRQMLMYMWRGVWRDATPPCVVKAVAPKDQGWQGELSAVSQMLKSRNSHGASSKRSRGPGASDNEEVGWASDSSDNSRYSGMSGMGMKRDRTGSPSPFSEQPAAKRGRGDDDPFAGRAAPSLAHIKGTSFKIKLGSKAVIKGMVS